MLDVRTMLVSGFAGATSILKYPTELATAPLASGVPTVRKLEACTGGLHDGKASGGPCVRLGAVHELYAGTSDTRRGVAPLGRGCVAPAVAAIHSMPSATTARADDSTILPLAVVIAISLPYLVGSCCAASLARIVTFVGSD